MNNDKLALPPGFESLEALVVRWALPTEQIRYELRLATPLPELRDFYNAMHPRMDEVLQHLSGFPADDLPALPDATRQLYRLALSYFEASHPIELHWKSQDLENAFPAARIIYQGPSCAEN